MTEYKPPLSRNDARSLFSYQAVLHFELNSELWQFIKEEQCPETESPEEAIIRLLQERYKLSCQGY